MLVIADSLMRHIDKIIIKKKPRNWILTIKVDETGGDPLEYEYPAGDEYDHVIFCSAGNAMHKPFGKRAWNILK